MHVQINNALCPFCLSPINNSCNYQYIYSCKCNYTNIQIKQDSIDYYNFCINPTDGYVLVAFNSKDSTKHTCICMVHKNNKEFIPKISTIKSIPCFISPIIENNIIQFQKMVDKFNKLYTIS